MIGIEVVLDEKLNSVRFILDILHLLKLEQSYFRIGDIDIVYNSSKNTCCLENNVYSHNTVLSFLSEIKHLNFLSLFAFETESDVCLVDNYTQFYNSRCELVLLCADSIFFELYAKKKSDIQIVMKICKKYGQNNVTFKRLDDDKRKRFSVI